MLWGARSASGTAKQLFCVCTTHGQCKTELLLFHQVQGKKVFFQYSHRGEVTDEHRHKGPRQAPVSGGATGTSSSTGASAVLLLVVSHAQVRFTKALLSGLSCSYSTVEVAGSKKPDGCKQGCHTVLAVSLAPLETLHGLLGCKSLSQASEARCRQHLPDNYTHLPPQSCALASAVALSPKGVRSSGDAASLSLHTLQSLCRVPHICQHAPLAARSYTSTPPDWLPHLLTPLPTVPSLTALLLTAFSAAASSSLISSLRLHTSLLFTAHPARPPHLSFDPRCAATPLRHVCCLLTTALAS